MDMNELVNALKENTEEMRRLNQLLAPAIRATDTIQEKRDTTNKLRAGIKKQLNKLYADPN